jgi:hypothetical protein
MAAPKRSFVEVGCAPPHRLPTASSGLLHHDIGWMNAGEHTTGGPCGDQLNSQAQSEADFEDAMVGLDVQAVDKPAIVISALATNIPAARRAIPGVAQTAGPADALAQAAFSAAGVPARSIVVIAIH